MEGIGWFIFHDQVLLELCNRERWKSPSSTVEAARSECLLGGGTFSMESVSWLRFLFDLSMAKLVNMICPPL